MVPSCPSRAGGEGTAGSGWRVDVWLLAAGTFLTMVSFSMVLPFLPLYLREMGVRSGVETWSGLIYGASFLSGGLMAPVWGSLGDRVGQKAMVLRSGVGIALAHVLMSRAASPEQLLLLRVLNGLLGGFLPAANALVVAIVPAAEVGGALSLLQVASGAGTIAGPLFGGALADGVGIRGTFLAAAAVMGLSTALVAAFVRAGGRPPAAAARERREGLGTLLAGRPLQAALLLVFAVQAASMAVQPVIALLVARLDDAAVSLQAGAVFSAAGLASLVGTPAFSALARRRGPWLSIALAGGGLAMGLQGLAASVAQLGAARFAFGLFQGGASVLGNVLVAGAVAPARRGSAFGLASSAWMLGSVVGPVVGGAAASLLGLRGPFWVAAGLLLALAAWARGAGFDRPRGGQDRSVTEVHLPRS